MKTVLKSGLSFGLTSGIITTLGLIVGLQAGIQSKTAIIGAILTIAIADSLADACGMDFSKEAENNESVKELWISGLSTFVGKFFTALTFILPIFFLPLNAVIITCVIWGLAIIIIFSYSMAKQENKNAKLVIGTHILLTLLVVLLTHLVGSWINSSFQ